MFPEKNQTNVSDWVIWFLPSTERMTYSAWVLTHMEINCTWLYLFACPSNFTGVNRRVQHCWHQNAAVFLQRRLSIKTHSMRHALLHFFPSFRIDLHGFAAWKASHICPKVFVNLLAGASNWEEVVLPNAKFNILRAQDIGLSKHALITSKVTISGRKWWSTIKFGEIHAITDKKYHCPMSP